MSDKLRLAQLLAQVRLEEAEWWEHLVSDCPKDNPDTVAKECIYCERLAALRAAGGGK